MQKGTMSENFEDVCRDEDYELQRHQTDNKGDYTLVFKNKKGGQDKTFNNISKSRIENLPSKWKDVILK